jgi:hypothetical protein
MMLRAASTQPGRLAAIGAGAATCLLAAGAFALAITLAPARSGPNCLTDDCVTYPYTDVAAYVPEEYWWMLPAAVLPLAFLVLLLSVRAGSGRGRQVGADLAVLVTGAGLTVLATAYAIQLMVVQPSLVKGESDQLVLWSQYNPHGLFIALESVGYFLLSIAMVASATLFPGAGGTRRAIRYVARGFGLAGVLGLPVLALALRSDLEYQYEVLGILAVWGGLIVLGLLVTIHLVRGEPHA